MDKLRIGIDLDGVLANFSRSVIPIANRLFHKHLPLDYAPQSWDYTEVLTKEQWNKIWEEIAVTPYFWYKESALIDGVKALQRFLDSSKGYKTQVYYITSRMMTGNVSAKDQTYMWLEDRNLISYRDRLFVTSSAKQKPDVIRDNRIEFYLDDYAPTIEDLQTNPDCQSFLFDAPYNRYAAHLPRVWSVAEYLNKVTNA